MKNNSSQTTSMLDVKQAIMIFLQTVAILFACTVATGAPPMAAMITGCFGAIALMIASIMSGSRFSVQPPIVSMVVAGTIIVAFGYEGATGVFVAAAMIQAVLGVTRVGKLMISWISPTATKGVIAALALTLMVQMVYVWLGLGTEYGKDVWTLLVSFPTQLQAMSPESLILGIVLFFVMGLLWIMKQETLPHEWMAKIPTAFVLLIVGVVLGYLFQGQSYMPRETMLVWPSMAYAETWQFWHYAMIIAVLGALQTASFAQAQQDTTKVSKHIAMLGISNLVSAMFSGMPMQAKIDRFTRESQELGVLRGLVIACAVGLLILVLFVFPLVSMIPMAALAVVALGTVGRYVSPTVFTHVWESGHKAFAVFMVAMIVGLVPDFALVSLIAATVVDKVWTYIRMAKPVPIYLYEVAITQQPDGYYAKLIPTDFFADASVLEHALAEVPAKADLHIDVSRCDIQPGFYEALERAALARQGRVMVIHDEEDVYEHILDHYPHILN